MPVCTGATTLRCVGHTFTSSGMKWLTLISPSPFPLNCDVINIHEYTLHMIIVFVIFFFFFFLVLFLFQSKA